MRPYLIIALFFIYVIPCDALVPFIVEDPTNCEIEVSVPDDFHVCFDEEFSLDGEIFGDYEDFIWLEDGDETNYDLDEDLTVDGTRTFTLIAWNTSEENIIVNGDFEDGDSDFTTDYELGTFSCYGAGFLDCEGTYGILDNPNLGHVSFAACSDADGGGNMMVVNGASNLQQIWCQEVCVEAGASYEFSAWATSVNPSSPAQLQFSIDGSLIGELFSISADLCSWEQFEAEWVAESNTTIEICVTNQNTASGGNDFAIDNIGFYQVCEDEASFTVTHSEFEVELLGLEDMDCNTSESEVLALVDPPANYDFQLFYEGDELDTDTDDEYYSILYQLGEYSLIVTDQYGCELEIDFEIEGDLEEPDIQLSLSNMIDCINLTSVLEADSKDRGLDYAWYDSLGNLLGTDEELSVDSAGYYFMEVIDPDNGCSSIDSILLEEDLQYPEFSIEGLAPVDCSSNETSLYLTLSSDSVVWSFNTLVIQSNTDSILVEESGIYYATVALDNGCSATDSFELISHEPYFEYTLEFDNLINCQSPYSSIDLAVDTTVYELSWIGLDNSYADSLSFEIGTAGTYSFTLTDSLSCEISDSLVISEDFELPVFTLEEDTIDCISNEALFFITDPDNTLEVSWSLDGAEEVVSDSIILNQTGLLYYNVTSANGCSIYDSTMIQASLDFPVLSIEGSNIDCNNPFVELAAESDQMDLSYSWLLPNGSTATEPSISVNEAGMYQLEVINSQACIARSSYLVELDTISPEFELEDTAVLDCNNTELIGELIMIGNFQSIESEGSWLDSTTLQYSIYESGDYTVTVHADNGCSSQQTLSVQMDTLSPSLTLGPDLTLNCDQSEFDLEIPDASNFDRTQWSTSDTLISNSTIVAREAGEYQATVWAANGCSTSKSLYIDEDFEKPEFSIRSTTIDCIDEYSEVIIETSDNYSSHQVLHMGQLVSEELDFQTQITDSLEVIVVGQNGCENSDFHQIKIDTVRLEFDLYADTLDCSTKEVMLQLEVAQSFQESYLLDNTGTQIGDHSSLIDQAGSYTLVLENMNGCTSESTIEIIEINDPPLINSYSEESLICSESILLNALDITGGSSPYKLIIDNASVELNALPYEIMSQGNHYITVIDQNECQADTSLYIDELIPVDAYLATEIQIKFGESESLQLSLNKDLEEIESIHWYPSYGLSCDDCLEPVVTADEESIYTVVVRDKEGCEQELEIRVLVIKDVRYFVPNVIVSGSPNNNSFTIFAKDGDIVKINKMQIFDRWGNLVFTREDFEANDPSLGWDGRFDKDYGEQGVYVYFAELELRTGETEIISGDVTLMR